MEEETCTICLKKIKTKSSKTLLNKKYVTKCKCKYYYHNRCIKTWMRRKKTCPTCREIIFDNKYDMYKNSMKDFVWIILIYYFKFILLIYKPFLFFIFTVTFSSLITLIFFPVELPTVIVVRKILKYTLYFSWAFVLPTFFLLQFYRINSYRINLYLRNA